MHNRQIKVLVLRIMIFLCGTNLVVLTPCGSGFAHAPDTLWTKTYGGTDDDEGWSVQQTSDGGFIIAGETYSLGAGQNDVYLVKTDEDGDTLWTKTYGGTRNDGGWSVQQTSDGGYIVAGYTTLQGSNYWDVYLIKTDADGDTLWTRAYGGGQGDYAFSVQETSDSGYIITGNTYSFGPGFWDIYLLKTDANGDTLWTRTYGGISSDGGYSVQETSDNGYIVAGWTYSFGVGLADVYLIKTDANGDTLWAKTYGGTNYDIGYSVQQTSDNGYIIAGETWSFTRAGAVYLIKTDVDGDTLWTRTYGGRLYDGGYSVKETSDSGYIITGYTESFGTGVDVYLVRTDANGDTLWTDRYGGTNTDVGRAVQQTSDNGYIIAGTTESFSADSTAAVYLIRIGPPEVGIEEKEFSENGLSIFQSVPNPFKERTFVSYELPMSSSACIVIYNLLGQRVRTLVDTEQNAGLHTVIWDGRDNSGRKVPSGPYFLRLVIRSVGNGYTGIWTRNHTAARKISVMR